MNQKDTVQPRHELGMVGLGVMGRNLLLNMAEHGFPVAGYDLDAGKVEALRAEGAGFDLAPAADLQAMLGLLRRPRAVMLLVPAGAPVDAVIAELAPRLQAGDLIIDAGNSHFLDTDRRAAGLAAKGLGFMGMGVSGGEEGARRGPSLMPGGSPEAYQRVRPLLEAVAAQAGGEPCVAHVGTGSAGHFVKMVHNGIEYALMELIAECYDLMKRGLGMDNAGIRQAFQGWNEGGQGGYLMEITERIFGRQDARSGRELIDAIAGVARQKGTGMWTSQSAMELQVPAPTIDLAVAQRDLSALDRQREQAGLLLPRATGLHRHEGDRGVFLVFLGQALQAGTLLAFAQGMAVLGGSERYGFRLDLATVARIWRGGCIIRTPLLEDIRAAYGRQPALANLLLDPELARMALAREEGLRTVVGAGARLALPIPALMSALAYLDGFRSAWLPANLIQAQRDYFGAHTYERVDMPGIFHTDWEKE